jgi:hypothetical protein
MTWLRLPVFAAALIALAACETVGGPPAPPKSAPASATVFRPDDFSWSAVPGKGRIDGRLAYRRSEQRYTCAGAAVILTPETPWTRRRMSILYKSPTYAALPIAEVRARTPSEPDEDYSAFIRRAVCTSADTFTFSKLPDGAWFAITIAKPVGGAGPNLAIMRRVETRNGRAVSLGL